MKIKTLIIYLLILGQIAFSAEKDEMRIGAGAIVKENFRWGNNLKFHKNDPMIVPIPFLRLRVDRFEISKGFKLHIIDQPPYWFSFDIAPIGHPYRNVTMKKRQESFAGGTEIKVMFLNLSHYQDFSNKSRGTVNKLGLSKRFVINDKHFFIIGADYKRYSASYTDFYFGVRPEEVNSERSLYNGERSSSLTANTMLMSAFTPRVSAFNSFSYTKYSNEIYQSPTVAKKHEWSFMTSLSYKIF